MVRAQARAGMCAHVGFPRLCSCGGCLHTAVYLSASPLWTKCYCFCDTSVREKACCAAASVCAGDVSAAPCLQVAAGELSEATRLRQARPLSARIRFSPMDPKLRYPAVTAITSYQLQLVYECLFNVCPLFVNHPKLKPRFMQFQLDCALLSMLVRACWMKTIFLVHLCACLYCVYVAHAQVLALRLQAHACRWECVPVLGSALFLVCTMLAGKIFW